MLFTIRDGSDPVARADATLLRALGLPSGGVLKVGDTHVLVTGSDMAEPSAIAIGEQSRVNAGIRLGNSVDATRAVLSPASVVTVQGDTLPGTPTQLVNALKGRPVTRGDTVLIDSAYLDHRGDDPISISITAVTPGDAGLIAASTRFTTTSAQSPIPNPDLPTRPTAPRHIRPRESSPPARRSSPDSTTNSTCSRVG